jgi:hypothetical protein
MAKWAFEPGHTAAEFGARHMMATHVRGHFKDVHGTLKFDLPGFGGECDSAGFWIADESRLTTSSGGMLTIIWNCFIDSNRRQLKRQSLFEIGSGLSETRSGETFQ